MNLEEIIAELKELNKEPLLERAIEMATANAELSTKLDEQDVLILELNAELESAGKQQSGKGFKVITVDGTDYRFTAPHYDLIGGKRIFTKDLDANSEEVSRLIKIGSGILEIVLPENEEE